MSIAFADKSIKKHERGVCLFKVRSDRGFSFSATERSDDKLTNRESATGNVFYCGISEK